MLNSEKFLFPSSNSSQYSVGFCDVVLKFHSFFWWPLLFTLFQMCHCYPSPPPPLSPPQISSTLFCSFQGVTAFALPNLHAHPLFLSSGEKSSVPCLAMSPFCATPSTISRQGMIDSLKGGLVHAFSFGGGVAGGAKG